MAPKLKTSEDWEREDHYRMEKAVAEIQRSPNLRFFFRSLLSATGATGTPSGGDSHYMALAVGRHSVGTDLIATLTEHQPRLYGTLLTEDAVESLTRTNITEGPPQDEIS